MSSLVRHPGTYDHSPFGPNPGPYFDVQHGALWDSVSLPAGATLTPRINLFEDPLRSDSTRTLVDTNMTQSRKLDAPESFQIQRVVLTFSATVDNRDFYSILERLTWTVWIGQKRYLWAVAISMPTANNIPAPVRACTFCRRVYVGCDECPGCGATSFTLPVPELDQGGKRFYMDLIWPVDILNQMSFFATLELGTPHTLWKDFKMWFHLEGLHARGTQ